MVYGASAIAVALPRGVRVTLRPSAALSVSLSSDVQGELLRQPSDEQHQALLQAFVDLIATYERSETFEVHAKFEVPAGAGLGASAALGVALVRALNGHWQIEEAVEDVMERALVWERVFHETPSGVDSAVAALGRPILYRRQTSGSCWEPLDVGAPLTLVIGHTGKFSSTAKMVRKVQEQQTGGQIAAHRALRELQELATQGATALSHGDLAQLGTCMLEAQQHLSALGVSSPELGRLCKAAVDAGALGAKLTGGGGGGCMVAVTRDEAAGMAVEAALKQAGATWIARCPL